jgi:hypothetical protein
MATLKQTIREIKRGADPCEVPAVDDHWKRLRKVAAFILKDPDRLKMDDWVRPEGGSIYDKDARFRDIAHTCGTTACIAGWAILLAGQDGKALLHATDEAFGTGEGSEERAGGILLGEVASEHFYDTEEEALEFLEAALEEG